MNHRSLRVAWDNSLARRNPTGTGVYATQLIRELGEAPGLDLQVFAGWDPAKRKPGEFGSQGIFSRGMRAASGMLWGHAYFPYLLRKGRFDLLHSPSFVVPFACPCPSVVTIYDVSFLKFPQHFERRWRTYVNAVMPAVLRRVAAVICISEHTRQDLLESYDVSPRKVHVVYCGIDHTQFHPGATCGGDWIASMGIRKDYVLHVGTLSERKNLPMLLRAVALLRSQGRFKDYQLVLAGPEVSVLSGATEIRETIRNLGLTDVVVLTGHVPEGQLAGLYAQAKVLVMPSLYEGFGLPVLESMAVGTPVVASNTTSLPEIVADAGLTVPPQDEPGWAQAIGELLEQPARAEEFRRRGLARAAQFSWRQAAAETLDIYRAAVGSSAAGRSTTG
jgi:glycosyltransferase involved in cell wall biosynthesis